VRKKRPDLKIEGPIQYDAAVDMEVGQSKMPNSEWQDRQVCLFSGFKYRKQHVQRRFKRNGSIGYWAYVARVEQTRKRFKPRMYGR
jgi:hypothetical protein